MTNSRSAFPEIVCVKKKGFKVSPGENTIFGFQNGCIRKRKTGTFFEPLKGKKHPEIEHNSTYIHTYIHAPLSMLASVSHGMKQCEEQANIQTHNPIKIWADRDTATLITHSEPQSHAPCFTCLQYFTGWIQSSFCIFDLMCGFPGHDIPTCSNIPFAFPAVIWKIAVAVSAG